MKGFLTADCKPARNTFLPPFFCMVSTFSKYDENSTLILRTCSSYSIS